jgi:hypothetical protein
MSINVLGSARLREPIAILSYGDQCGAEEGGKYQRSGRESAASPRRVPAATGCAFDAQRPAGDDEKPQNILPTAIRTVMTSSASRTHEPTMGPRGLTALLCALLATAWAAGPAAAQQQAQQQAEQQVEQQADKVAAAQSIELFEKQVRPLLFEHCYACHSEKSGKREGELLLDSVAAIQRGGSRGPLIDAVHPRDSLLLRVLSYQDDELQMPPEGRLPAELRRAVEAWVHSGAVLPDSGTPAPGVPAGSHSAEIDWQAARQFWAYQPLVSGALPEVHRGQWVQCRCDAFILQRLEQQQLAPAPAADRATLIRRATFDVIGLPATPREVAEFVADDSPDAYERLIERLLAAPQYGERWARFWLDLARYADVTPNWLDSTERGWLYRDWVIRAWNEDLPYDQFIRLQLAADLMEPVDPRDLAALGFLGLSPTRWKELRLAPVLIETIVAEEWDERVDVVTRAFLGLNVACARCHDHKFDPITMQDYYGLAGVFASSQLSERPLLPAQEARQVRAARRQVEQLQQQLDEVQDKKSDAAKQLADEMARIRRETPHYDEPWAHVLTEASLYVLPDGEDKTRLDVRPGEARDLPVYLRGNPATPGPPAPRRFLQILSPATPRPFQQGSGRLELADCLFGEGRDLAARVIVNRVWREIFGRGLVRTPSDFGSQGERPTHPELLDDLASDFIRHGWSMKWLQRELLLSATYRQSSAHRPEAQRVDPENRLLWRMHRRRLDVERWRDSLLSVAGNLDSRMYGPGADLADPAHRRRTIYGQVGRHELNDLLRLYDYPDPSAHSPAREITTTPLQQLFVLNSPFLQQQSRIIADELQWRYPDDSPAERIERSYQRLFARQPSPSELTAGQQFLDATAPSGQAALENPAEAWRMYVQALLGLNEFMFVD